MVTHGMIDKSFANPFNQNEIVLKNCSGSGVVITIFDATGEFGAENFLRSFESADVINYETALAIATILKRIESTDQYSLMNISTHSNIEVYLNCLSSIHEK